MSRPMAPTAAAASVAAILRDMSNLLLRGFDGDEVDRRAHTATETRQVSARGPVARMTIESRPNQSSRVRRSLTSRLPSRARMTPRKAILRSRRRITFQAAPRCRASISSSTRIVFPSARSRTLSLLDAVHEPVFRTSPSSAVATEGSESAAHAATATSRSVFRSNLIVRRACPRPGWWRNWTSVLGPAGRQTVPLGPERGLRAVGDADLSEDARQVCLDRLLADVQAPRDELVRQPFGHEDEHLALAVGQVRNRCPRLPRTEDRARSPRVERRVTTCRRLDCLRELGRLDVLEQIAGRSRVDRLEDPLAVGERREHDDGDVGLLRLYAPRRLDTVDGGHLEVHEHDIWALAGAERDDRLAVGCLSDELDAVERR